MKKSFLILLLPLILCGCGEPENISPSPAHTCADNNNDHLCDVCSTKLSECADNNKDHFCDVCGAKLSSCNDGDNDGHCDVCGKEMDNLLSGITIKKQPNKALYYAGEVFDPAGMVVNAQYKDGTYAPVTDYTYDEKPLELTDKFVTIVYKQFSAKVSISVIEKPVVEQEYTATIKLSGNEFSAVATAAGVQFDDSGYSRNVEMLKEYCDSGLEYEDLITSISCKNLNTAEWEKGAALCIGTGYYGNDKFKAGTFKWVSGVKIYKVELKARAYTKRNDYSGDIIDSPAHVQLDGDDLELMPSGATTAEVKTLTKDYAEGVNSFSITSTGARVVVQEVTITWRG